MPEDSHLSNADDASALYLNVHPEIIFIDTCAANRDEALHRILNDSGSREFRVVFLDRSTDGVETISRVLASPMCFKTAHILAGGGQGKMQLGSVYLCVANIGRYAGKIAAWHLSLSADAEIHIHGCDLNSAEGETLLEDLSVLTSARILAQPAIPSAETSPPSF